MDCYIFDIDGTIANIEHRRHWVRSKPKNWVAFNKAMKDDVPFEPVVRIVRNLAMCGNRIVLCSGRHDTHYKETGLWMKDVAMIHFDALYMRKEKDNRSDDIVKSELLDRILADGYKPLAVFDDRKRVKRMWVSRGLFVFDVNQNDEEF